MEEGGFTVVMPNMKSATDGVNSMKVQNKLTSIKETKLETGYMNKRKTKEIGKSDFYKFQTKHLKKDLLIDLKRGFADDLKKIEQFKRVKTFE